MALICLAKLMNLGRYRIWEFLLSGTAYIRAPSTTWCCLARKRLSSRASKRVCTRARARVFREVRLENGKFKTTFTCVY